jgi:hypothetical protein
VSATVDNQTSTATVTVVKPSLPDIPPVVITKMILLGSNLTGGDFNLMSNGQFVNGLYHDILGRMADQAGLNGWVTALESGISRSAVAAGFWESAEHRGIEVDQFYATLLGRAADPAGRAGWVRLLMAGASEQQVEIAFLSSPEYAAKHPSDALFIEGLCANVLGRPASPAEVLAWEQALQSMSRAAVARDFLTSLEWAHDEVNTLYFQALGRVADPLGLAVFVPPLQSGAPLEIVADALFASQEYYLQPH